MKTIYFIRHAKSSWSDESLSDFQRGLNKRGKSDAPMMGKRLLEKKIKPSLIISSPAKRAKKTAKIIAKQISFPKNLISYNNGLYEASVENYFDLISNIKDINSSVFIVAHNPAITQICEVLSDTILGNIPTCGIVCIEFKVDSFKDIKSLKGDILFFDYPKNLK